jgi:hypothetical protein
MVAVAVLVVVLTASGSSSSAARSAAPTAKKSVTFRLIEKSVGFNFIDNPPRQGFNSPPLMGDQFAITSNLLTKGGAHAGTLEATCTVTRGGDHTRGPCYGVFALKGGQIAGIALLSEGNTTHISVVGGTGVYEGVSGSVTSVSRGENSLYTDDTVHLIWP